MTTRTCSSPPNTTCEQARLLMTAGQPFCTKITFFLLKRRMVTIRSQRPDRYFVAPAVCLRFIPLIPPRARTQKELRHGPLARPAREVKDFLWTAGMASTALQEAPASGLLPACHWIIGR